MPASDDALEPELELEAELDVALEARLVVVMLELELERREDTVEIDELLLGVAMGEEEVAVVELVCDGL